MLLDQLIKPKRNPAADIVALTEALKSALGQRLQSVVLFGSLAGGEFRPERSDVNLLIISALSMDALEAMGPAIAGWLNKGYVPPVLVEPDGLDEFAQDFPIEFLDMQDTRRLLFGKDPFDTLNVDKKYLKSQCEHDLALTQLRLRQAMAASKGNAKKIRQALIISTASVMALFRAALRIEESATKIDKIQAVEELAKRVGFDETILRRLNDLKMQRASDDMKGLAMQYLNMIAAVLTYLRKK